MNMSAIIIALGVVAAATATYVLRRFVGQTPPDRGIDVGMVSTNWLSERRKDSTAE